MVPYGEPTEFFYHCSVAWSESTEYANPLQMSSTGVSTEFGYHFPVALRGQATEFPSLADNLYLRTQWIRNFVFWEERIMAEEYRRLSFKP